VCRACLAPFLSDRLFFITVRLPERRRKFDDTDFEHEWVFRHECGGTNAPMRVNY
jgi:hypothetical protein